MFVNLKYDFRREFQKYPKKGWLRKVFGCIWSQGFQAMVGYRLCRWLVLKHFPFLHIFIQRAIELTTGVSIPSTVKIGKGLLIEHFGGIVINAGSQIGDFCTISHQVTIGNKVPGGKSPIIGNHVYICVGAKILGDITIGYNCIIGANAVVLESIPPNSIAAGIPAKVVKQMVDISSYRDFFYEG